MHSSFMSPTYHKADYSPNEWALVETLDATHAACGDVGHIVFTVGNADTNFAPRILFRDVIVPGPPARAKTIRELAAEQNAARGLRPKPAMSEHGAAFIAELRRLRDMARQSTYLVRVTCGNGLPVWTFDSPSLVTVERTRVLQSV